jgi:hypothetical protein
MDGPHDQALVEHDDNGIIPNRKAIASLAMLVTGEIWNERNVQVFHNKHVPHSLCFVR